MTPEADSLTRKSIRHIYFAKQLATSIRTPAAMKSSLFLWKTSHIHSSAFLFCLPQKLWAVNSRWGFVKTKSPGSTTTGGIRSSFLLPQHHRRREREAGQVHAATKWAWLWGRSWA